MEMVSQLVAAPCSSSPPGLFPTLAFCALVTSKGLDWPGVLTGPAALCVQLRRGTRFSFVPRVPFFSHFFFPTNVIG
jgi:hypothetical protein